MQNQIGTRLHLHQGFNIMLISVGFSYSSYVSSEPARRVSIQKFHSPMIQLQGGLNSTSMLLPFCCTNLACHTSGCAASLPCSSIKTNTTVPTSGFGLPPEIGKLTICFKSGKLFDTLHFFISCIRSLF